MRVGVIGGGINGLCCAWKIAEQGHDVCLYERHSIMGATSSASSKLLHGGLRYLENGEFRLVRESLQERNAWIKRVPHLAKPLKIIMPIYRGSKRSRWKVGFGLALYDLLAGTRDFPRARWLTSESLLSNENNLNSDGLLGGYEFFDGIMDDQALGLWVAEHAKKLGVEIKEECEVVSVSESGHATLASGEVVAFDCIVNVAGPWARDLLDKSNSKVPYDIDLIRGSHIVCDLFSEHAYLLEVPWDKRIFFILPWKGGNLVGTTEIRQTLRDTVEPDEDEVLYLIRAVEYYFPMLKLKILDKFAGLRPLLKSSDDPRKASREYALHRRGKLISVIGGKWTTAPALAAKVLKKI